MGRVRASWLIIMAVALITVAVRPLREQTKLLFLTRGRGALPAIVIPASSYDGPAWVQDLCQGAPGFVARSSPHEAELWMAAGFISPDLTTRLDLLRRAAEQPEAPPVVWARYAEALAEALPEYGRLGTEDADPENPRAVAKAREALQYRRVPDRLDPDRAASLLAALVSWEKADPNNAVPLALQTPVLYGLHRDREALARWVEAGARPEARDCYHETALAITRLLVGLGLPEPEAMMQTVALDRVGGQTHTGLRAGARIARYEGRVARLQGRNQEAISLWESSLALGRRLQASSNTLLDYLSATAIQSIGASPTWRWYEDKDTDLPSGVLAGGRLWYGPQHVFYVDQVGEARDAALRDRLVEEKARRQLLNARESWERATGAQMGEAMQPEILLLIAWGVGGIALVHLLVFLVAFLWPGRRYDEPSTIRRGWEVAGALHAFLPQLVFGVLIYWGVRMVLGGQDPFKHPATIAVLVTAAVAFLLLLFAELRLTYVRNAPKKGVWRGNLLRLSRAGLVIGALLYLGLSSAAAWQRQAWARAWSPSHATELAWVKRDLGAKWDDPPIPKDAWRAEYPKLKTR